MSVNDYSDYLFQLTTFHEFQTAYIASGSGEDIPIDDGRFLVIVDEKGNRLASKSPNGHWKIDKPKWKGFGPEIISYKNVLKYDVSVHENE